MRGLRVSFGNGGPRFDFSRPAVDFETTLQNALVNVGTQRESDRIFPDRGTDMALDAAQGRMINDVWAVHSSNFAALRTLAFLQSTELQSNPFKLQDFKLRSLGIVDQSIEFSVRAESSQGDVIGADVIV